MGIVAAVVLTVCGIGAAVAVQPAATPVPPPATGTRAVTIIDQPVTDQAVTTTTTTAPPPQAAQAAGSASATITVIITKPVP